MDCIDVGVGCTEWLRVGVGYEWPGTATKAGGHRGGGLGGLDCGGVDDAGAAGTGTACYVEAYAVLWLWYAVLCGADRCCDH